MNKEEFAKNIAEELNEAINSAISREFFRKRYRYKNIWFTIVGTYRPSPTPVNGNINLEVIWDFKLNNRHLVNEPSRYILLGYSNIEQEIKQLVSNTMKKIDNLEKVLTSVEEDVETLRKLVKLKNGGGR